ncbi:MAG: hypothetical protein LC676_10885 [Loktanella sp.]|nr:hypothetical protein [Loktanella sp.]
MVSSEITKEGVTALYDKKFGRGWRAEIANALHMDTTQISRANPPTLRVLWIVFEWLDATPEIVWPARYEGLRKLSERSSS